MKKTIIALFALAPAVAVAYEAPTAQVVTVGGMDGSHEFVTSSITVNNTQTGSTDLTDLTQVLVNNDANCKMWGTSKDGAIAGTWSNAAALAEMNTTLNLDASFTAQDFSEGSTIYYTAPGNGGSHASIVLTLSPSVYDLNVYPYDITIFATATCWSGSLDNFSVTGLDNAKVSYATNDGEGFSSDPVFSSGSSAITLIKIHGLLTSDPIILSSTTGKNGWQSVSYIVTPEPATATLSLLALAGLAARRRRH